MHELVLEVHLQGEGLPRVHLPRVHAAAVAAAPAGLVHAVGAAGRPRLVPEHGLLHVEEREVLPQVGQRQRRLRLVPLLVDNVRETERARHEVVRPPRRQPDVPPCFPWTHRRFHLHRDPAPL